MNTLDYLLSTEYPSEEIINSTAIAMTTLYNPNKESDSLRSELAKNTVLLASKVMGYTVFIADTKSPDELLRWFEDEGANVHQYPSSTGMGEKKRLVIQSAYDSGKPIIALTEPEKLFYIPEIGKTTLPILRGEADLVIPERKDLSSYPKAQQKWEPKGNQFAEQLTGYHLDHWFGPRTWHRDLSHHFLDYKGEPDLWDSFFVPILDILYKDMKKEQSKVLGVEVDYSHPSAQRKLEDRDPTFVEKRKQQFLDITQYLEKYWEHLHHQERR